MTIITFPLSEMTAAHPHLRRFDLRRDLDAVATLVEECFSSTLDADGKRYVRQMRNTAQHPQFLRWAANMAERMSVPFNGFVWEQDGRVVGNLSLIPMHTRGRKIYLIANVAVHADFRRKGIARSLTEAALDECRRKRAHQIWLHVRQDNPGAQQLYEGLGFVERARRTQWYSNPLEGTRPSGSRPPVKGVSLQERRPAHWFQQLAWMNELHPELLEWYLPLNVNSLRPGLAGWFYRMLTGTLPRQWSALWNDRLLGVAAWVRSNASADRLWLAAHPEGETIAIRELLPLVQEKVGRRPFNVEYPAGRADEAFRAAGFEEHQTLIWMEYR